MNDKTKASGSNKQTDDQALAGVPPVEEKQVRKEAKETKDEPAVLPADETIVKELPENGVVLEGSSVTVSNPDATFAAASTGGVYADEFAGQGGTFVIDGETGQRKRAHEAVTDDKGKPIGFRPIP